MRCSQKELQKALNDEESVRGQLQSELAATKRHCRKLLSEARAAQYADLLAMLKRLNQSSSPTPLERFAKIEEIEQQYVAVFSITV